ncbi:hypothetical protein RhiirA5_447034 [Rhizophagus irregularis]|uniref:Uncharacterized protein n=1 Tax=Rhizophagus irregularis TaxID=588596 RepID=A0A2N0NBF8_9GLOM|nr:hypothetical protein RhiirA5_447034 [Rhizophagus irregularis]GET65282.1 hypothetical protein GLOIN_2v1776590 [Rhizophagus irregularis DAOM 181602=DAOM 197198]
MDCCEYVNENFTFSDKKNELRIMLILARVEYHLSPNEMKSLTIKQNKHKIK